MMYYEFKEVIEKRLSDMGLNYETKIVNKVNQMKEGIVFLNKRNIAPVLYLDDAYSMYKEGVSIDDLIFNTLRHANPEWAKKDDVLAALENKNNIIFTLVNKKKNEEMLKNVPHRIFCGELAVVYRVLVSKDDDCLTSAIIKNEFVKTMGIDEDELYMLARKNTPKLLRTKVIDMCGMMCVTNENEFYGAAAILVPGVLETIAKEKGDLILIPSSTIEFIILSVNEYNMSIDDLEAMISSANNSDLVEGEEYLGDTPFCYIAKTGEIKKMRDLFY